MKTLTKPLMGLMALALAGGLTACSSANEPKLDPARLTTVNVDPVGAVDGLTEDRVKSIDPTLTEALAPEVTNTEAYTRVVMDPKNPYHWFAVSAFPADDEHALWYANFKEFRAARAGTLEEVAVDGYSWGYVGYEPNEDTLTPMAGVIARNTHGEVFVCAWSGDEVPDADLALDLANHRIELLKEACEYPGA